MLDYEVPGIEQSDEEELTYFALFSDCDPVAFKDAVLESKWRKPWMKKLKPLKETILGSYLSFRKARRLLV
ncbi:hypothetical protein SLA2020_092600 [Shorea laevis]